MDWDVLGLFVLLAKIAGEALSSAVACSAALFSLGFALASVAAAYKFLKRRAPPPPFSAPWPAVTILKPLKGVDRELAECLRSFCRLDYPDFQLLFTLASPEDPALACVDGLRAEFPALDIGVVVSPNRIGFNPKINNVSNAAPLIKHSLILMSDSDIRVEPDFLRRAVAHLGDPAVGLVTCFYRSAPARGLWARLEALSINANFLPQAVTAAAFGMRFAMGAAILVRREVFEKVGGFALMADHLADDFILGEAVRQAGYRLEIAEPVVASTPDLVDGLEHVRHQARWARTIRLCHPAGYLGSFFLHGFSLLSLKLLLFGFEPRLAGLLAALWAAKAASKAAITRWSGGRGALESIWLLPLSEFVAFGAWLSGLRSSAILWRGELYAVGAQGRMVPVEPRAVP